MIVADRRLAETLLKALDTELSRYRKQVDARRAAAVATAVAAGLAFAAVAGGTDISNTSFAEAAYLAALAGVAALIAFIARHFGQVLVPPPLSAELLTRGLDASDRQQAEEILRDILRPEDINRKFIGRRDRAWWEFGGICIASGFALIIWPWLAATVAQSLGLPLAGASGGAPSAPAIAAYAMSAGPAAAAAAAVLGAAMAGWMFGQNAARPLVIQALDDLLEATFKAAETRELVDAAQGRARQTMSPEAAALLASIDRGLFALSRRRRR